MSVSRSMSKPTDLPHEVYPAPSMCDGSPSLQCRRFQVLQIGRRQIKMNRVVRLLAVVSAIVLLLATSCTRDPHGGQRPPSSESGHSDPNSESVAQAAEFSGPTEESSASVPDKKAVAVRTDSYRQSASDPSAADFIALYIDINSGDLRGTRSMVDGAPRYIIYESELSKEVRRLGIPIPEERRWEVVFRPPTGGMAITYAYRTLLPAVHRLLVLLDEVKAADQERLDVLGRFMTYLRTENPPAATAKADMLMQEVADRYGLESPFLPDYVEQLRHAH